MARVFPALFLGVLIVMSGAGCKEVMNPAVPGTYKPVIEFTVRGAAGGQTELNDLDDFNASSLNVKQSNDVDGDVEYMRHLDYLFLQKFKLTAISPGDLSWIGTLRFILKAPNLPDLALAYAQPNHQEGVRTLEFQPNDDALVEYFSDPNYTITAELWDTVRPPRDMRLKVEAEFTYQVDMIWIQSRHPILMGPMSPYGGMGVY